MNEFIKLIKMFSRYFGSKIDRKIGLSKIGIFGSKI
jgi:hypothetical protein